MLSDDIEKMLKEKAEDYYLLLSCSQNGEISHKAMTKLSANKNMFYFPLFRFVDALHILIDVSSKLLLENDDAKEMLGCKILENLNNKLLELSLFLHKELGVQDFHRAEENL